MSVSGKPTLGTVARAAGVSIPTVSQVLRGKGRISEETRARVMSAAERLHYVQDSRAASMRSGDNREIGFVINQLQNPFNAEVVSGVVDLLEAEGYLVSIVDARDDPGRQAQQLETFIKHGRRGLLWVPARETDPKVLDLLHAQNIPAVTFLRPFGCLDHVGVRDAEATETATSFLIDMGHRQIAYLGGTELASVRRNRIAGYERALARSRRRDSIVWACGDNKLAGLEAMSALLDAHPDVTGVVCNGDMVALGACLALVRLGKTPGREVSVIGFDDIQDAAVATPPLTTMAVHPRALGHTLATTLLERIAEPNRPRAVTEIAGELVVRATTGPSITR